MSEENLGDDFTLPPEPATDDGDMTRLVLQHCVVPAYQFIIQVQPEQPTVINTQLTFHLWSIVFVAEQQTEDFSYFSVRAHLKGLSFPFRKCCRTFIVLQLSVPAR